jgi:hypothetical protein
VLPEDIPKVLRTLKPATALLKEQFTSMQRRNIIEPRKKEYLKRSVLAKRKYKNVQERAFIDM